MEYLFTMYIKCNVFLTYESHFNEGRIKVLYILVTQTLTSNFQVNFPPKSLSPSHLCLSLSLYPSDVGLVTDRYLLSSPSRLSRGSTLEYQ